MSNHELPEDQEPVSKSQRKREMHALQDLGQRLLKLNQGMLDKLDLSEDLRRAIAEYKRLPNKNEAKRRQLQFIGRLMRDIDASSIEAALEQSNQHVEVEKRRFQKLETLRDALLAEDNDQLEQLIHDYPALEIQHLRQLIRQARKEAAGNKGPAASRKLFRYLREITEQH